MHSCDDSIQLESKYLQAEVLGSSRGHGKETGIAHSCRIDLHTDNCSSKEELWRRDTLDNSTATGTPMQCVGGTRDKVLRTTLT